MTNTGLEQPASWASNPGVRRSMVSNRRSDTTPELRLRSLLHASGARFRKDHRIDLDGLHVRADVAFPGRRIAVFVDGCFWHRCPLHGTDPKRNGDFWKHKLDANVERDRKVDRALRESGWTVLRFWEHVPAYEAAEQVLTSLVSGKGSVSTSPTAIDLFCGVGGMTLGLRRAGFDVVGALDVSELAILGYETNYPDTVVWRRDIRGVDPLEFARDCGVHAPGELDLLAGCPPCQGFSRVRTRTTVTVEDPRNGLVAQFARFAEALLPKALLMENVPALAQDRLRFTRFIRRLERAGYRISHQVLNTVHHGIPQRRRRLVLVARLEEAAPAFAARREGEATVRDAIGDLLLPEESEDYAHNHGETRSKAVKQRIKNVPHDGGSFRGSRRRQLDCHKGFDGFNDIYGRMAWDSPAPTITGGCINPSKGRFLHPDQDRAITLREAALLQGFPPDYHLPLDRGKYQAAALVGNALPPNFVADHAATIHRDLSEMTH